MIINVTIISGLAATWVITGLVNDPNAAAAVAGFGIFATLFTTALAGGHAK